MSITRLPTIRPPLSEPILPPATKSEWLADTSLPVILTEGECNVRALSEFSRHGSSNGRPTFLPVGLDEAWRMAASRKSDEGLPTQGIPALARINWGGPQHPRTVILLLDRSVDSIESLRAAKAKLGSILRGISADVLQFAWPTNPVEACTIADLLASVGPEQFARLLGALSQKSTPTVDLFAAAVLVCDYFAKDPGGLLHVFKCGVYRPVGESFIGQRVKALMTGWNVTANWNASIAITVADFIRVDAPELWPRPPADVINVANGLLDVNTHTLAPHSPGFLSCVQLPVIYDPEASCPAWDEFIADVFPEDAWQLGYELPAWLMSPDTSIQKAALGLGEGANGKSTYLKALTSFLGTENCASISLQKLETDRFAVARLVGKLANICPDLPSAHLTGTTIFKAITGGDRLHGERKYAESFEFESFAKLVFSANLPPHSDDSSHGFFRRFLVIPFTRVFEEGAADTIPRAELDARLAQPSELSGVLNQALVALNRIRQSGFTQPESVIRAWEEFRRETDPLSVWLDATVIDDPAGFVPKREVLDLYNAECEVKRRPKMSSTAFGLALKRLRKVGEAQRKVKEKITWVYTGIRISHMARFS